MKLVAMMLMQNEANRFLKKVLEEVTSYVDEIIIIDDAFSDDSVKIASSFPNIYIWKYLTSKFRDKQNKLREELLNYTLIRKPDWILALDADEILENKFKKEIRKMMEAPVNWYQFIRCDMWNETHYIAKVRKGIHLRKLIKVSSIINDRNFANMPKHCGSVPGCILSNTNGIITDLRIKHLGFLRKKDRLKRIEDNKYLVEKQGGESWRKYVKELEEYEINPPLLEEWRER